MSASEFAATQKARVPRHRGRLAVLALVAGLSLGAAAPDGARAAARLYDDTGNPANTYYESQGGNEAIDDLHLTAAGTLDSLVFEYYDPAPTGTFSATVRIYGNPGGADLDTTSLAGPFVANALPRGRHAIAIGLPHLPVTADLWVGVRFTSLTAGVILNSVPTIGHSHDLYLENGNFYWFGGDPKANFGLRLVGTPTALAVPDEPQAPAVALGAPAPDPFRHLTTLSYAIAGRGSVRLEVLDVSGRRVSTLFHGMRDAGRFTSAWTGHDDSGRALAAGVYFVRLESQGSVATRRVMLLP